MTTIQEIMTKLEEVKREYPEMDMCRCETCGKEFKVSELHSEVESENWEHPQTYLIYYCPECEDGGEVVDFWPSKESQEEWCRHLGADPKVLDEMVDKLDFHTYDFEIEDTLIDVKKAWDLPGQECDAPMKDLEHMLWDGCWDGEQKPVDIGHQEPHWSLTILADLFWPIIITIKPGEDWYTVVDGRHRLLKAWLLGHETIKVKIFDYEDLVKHAGIPREKVEGATPTWTVRNNDVLENG